MEFQKQFLELRLKVIQLYTIENKCKKYFGRKGFLTKDEFPDGFTETIKYSEKNLNKIKSIVDEVLNEKAEKKNQFCSH